MMHEILNDQMYYMGCVITMYHWERPRLSYALYRGRSIIVIYFIVGFHKHCGDLPENFHESSSQIEEIFSWLNHLFRSYSQLTNVPPRISVLEGQERIVYTGSGFVPEREDLKI